MSKKELDKISISDEVMSKIEDHCFSEVSHEVGGFLVGKIHDEKTEIQALIPSTKAQSQKTSLTFTHEAWDEAYQALAKDFPDASIVGWYHSHPGFGIFMSDYDSFIQQNFFGVSGQLALVIDPLAGRRGWFRWTGDRVKSLHEEDTFKDGLGGEAADYTPPAVTKLQKTSLESMSAVRSIVVVLIMLLSGLIGFLSGRSFKTSDMQGLESVNFNLSQQVNSLLSSSINGLFLESQKTDPASEKFYVRYALSEFEKSQSGWLDIVAQRFGTTPENLMKINPQLESSSFVDYINVPISGWKLVPPAIAKEPEASANIEPTESPVPKPSETQGEKK